MRGSGQVRAARKLGFAVVLVVVVVERRRDSGVVAYALGIVGLVESAASNALSVVAQGGNLAKGANNLQVGAHLDDAVVVLIANQCVAIAQADGARRQRASASTAEASRIAVRIGVGEVLPEHGAAFIGLHNAGVVGGGDQRMSVGKTAGKSDAAEEHSASHSVGVDDSAWGGMRDLECLVVVLIADEDVTIPQEFGAVRIVEQVGAVAGHAGRAILPDDLLV